MVTSLYAADEARRNVGNLAHMERLELLLDQTEVIDSKEHCEHNEILLPEKDAPILRGALGAQARFLVTGDKRHFGVYFGRNFEVHYGVLTIIEPSALLRLLKVGSTELDRTIQ